MNRRVGEPVKAPALRFVHPEGNNPKGMALLQHFFLQQQYGSH